MSTLLVEEIETELSQEFTSLGVGYLDAVRPHLVRFGNPAGSVKIEIRDSNGGKMAESASASISSLVITGGSGLDYVHGYFRFLVKSYFVESEAFQVAIVTSGYTFSETDFLGICRDFDPPKRYAAGFSPSGGFSSPFDIELWTFERRGRHL